MRCEVPLLRRDQGWYVYKNASQSSELYSLLDFKVRKNESVRDGDRKGRFGAAIPLTDPLYLGKS